MAEHAVVIVGEGPTVLMLAGEMALADVDVAVVERGPNQDFADEPGRDWSASRFSTRRSMQLR